MAMQIMAIIIFTNTFYLAKSHIKKNKNNKYYYVYKIILLKYYINDSSIHKSSIQYNSYKHIKEKKQNHIYNLKEISPNKCLINLTFH